MRKAVYWIPMMVLGFPLVLILMVTLPWVFILAFPFAVMSSSVLLFAASVWRGINRSYASPARALSTTAVPTFVVATYRDFFSGLDWPQGHPGPYNRNENVPKLENDLQAEVSPMAQKALGAGSAISQTG